MQIDVRLLIDFVLRVSLFHREFLHGCDELVFVKLLVAVLVVLGDELLHLGMETLGLSDAVQRVLVLGQGRNDFVEGQELVAVGVESAEGGPEDGVVLLSH